MATAAQQNVFQFMVPIREFTLLNSTDEDVKFMWEGETKVIPAFNKIVKPHPKYPDVSHSLMLEDGRYVPGTLTLTDIYTTGELGEERQAWSAANAVKNTLGIDVKSGKATSRYAEKGISLLPPRAEPNQIRAIAKAGRVRWERWQLAQAFNIVALHEDRNAKRQAQGMPPAPATREYSDAVRAIERADPQFMDEAKSIVYEDNNLVSFVDSPAWELEDTPVGTPVMDLLADEDEKVAEPIVPEAPKELSKAERIAEAGKIIEEARAKKAPRKPQGTVLISEVAE